MHHIVSSLRRVMWWSKTIASRDPLSPSCIRNIQAITDGLAQGCLHLKKVHRPYLRDDKTSTIAVLGHRQDGSTTTKCDIHDNFRRTLGLKFTPNNFRRAYLYFTLFESKRCSNFVSKIGPIFFRCLFSSIS